MSDTVLRRSRYLAAFAHMGDVYLYHDLYGYILQMSPDILAFLAEFAEPADTASVCERYQDAFDGQPPAQFVDIFTQFDCLVEPGEDEIDGLWHMVPVHARWTVWHRGADDSLTLYTAWGVGARNPPVARHELTPEQAALWRAIDGERSLGHLAEQFGRGPIQSLIPRLTHHDVQAVKLSGFPLSIYKGRSNMRPPYLTSTMPYAPYDLDAKSPPEARETTLSPRDYYREDVKDADAQFDHQETTLSHLFRVPHPALGGRSYGQALIDALLQRGALPGSGTVRVLEIGAGLGYVARDAYQRLRERGLDVDYHIVELSPALAAAQRARLADLGVTVRKGDVLETDLGSGFDLILANEMIGDLPAIELTRAQVGLTEHGPMPDRDARLAELGDIGALIVELDVALNDAPDPFYLNAGALTLLVRLWDALAAGGACVITEFGQLSAYPRLSTHLDHPELSIHFGHLQTAARKLGFTAAFEFVIDLLDMDRDARGMATTRSYFRALTAMLADHGVELRKLGYTETMLDELLGDAVSRNDIGALHFDRIEDRLMGLVPHEFKALILTRPRSGDE